VTDCTHRAAPGEIDLAALYEPVAQRLWVNRMLCRPRSVPICIPLNPKDALSCLLYETEEKSP
jgi:hypothetical protein